MLKTYQEERHGRALRQRRAKMNDVIETGYVQRYNKRDDSTEKDTSKMY